MDTLKINNKENIVNTYGLTPTLPYDMEGILVEKKGKDIKIEKTIDNKTVEYSLRLKEEIVGQTGDHVKIEKENIVSAKLEEKEKPKTDKEETRKAEDIIRELGLEFTEENMRMIEYLLKSGISVTKDTINSYLKSKEYLKNIVESIDPDSLVQLMDRGIDLEGENLQKIAETLEQVKDEKPSFSLKRFLRLERDLTYKEAEAIGKEIYGQKMGKDVYDTIIALKREKLPITKENIDKTIEVMSKLYNLKSVKDEAYINILKEDKNFNLENLYKLNNSYTEATTPSNVAARNFEIFTIAKETTIEGLKKVLQDLDIEDTADNIGLLREFVVNDMNMDKENYNKVIYMKESLKELIDLLDQEQIVNLNKRGIDPLKENIYDLVKEIKNRSKEELEESLTDERIKEISKDLEALGNIKDRDLLQLIKKGEDFTLKSIKEIIDTNLKKSIALENKTLDRTIHIANILNTLGENLKSDTISFTVRKYQFPTLENLFISHGEVKEVQAIEPIDKLEETFIFEEYLRARNSLTTNIIKESIKEGKVLEAMPLNELNSFIEKKINRYKESHRLAKEIKGIKGNEERLLPLIMKNELQMTLKEIKDINSFMKEEKSLGSILKDMMDSNNQEYKEELKEGIKLLQEKISTTLKNGEDVKEDYKELMNFLNNSYNSSEDRERPKEEHFKIQKKISKKDLVFQLPISMDNEYKSLNIIVPDANKAIDKNNMNFFISLDTKNLGVVTIDIEVRGKEVRLDLNDETKLNNNLSSLKEGLQKLGYNLVENKREAL